MCAATVPSPSLLNRHGDTGAARPPPAKISGLPPAPKMGSRAQAAGALALRLLLRGSASPALPVPAPNHRLTAGPRLGCATGSLATSTSPGGEREGGERKGKGRGRAMEPLRIPASLFRFPGARPALPILRHAGTAGAKAKPGLVLPRPRSHRVGARGASQRPHFDLLRVFSSIFPVLSGRGAPDPGVPRGRPAPPTAPALPGPPRRPLGLGEQNHPAARAPGVVPSGERHFPGTPKSLCRLPEESCPLRQRRSVASPEIQPQGRKKK